MPGARKPRRRVYTRRTRAGLELRVDGTLASLLKPGRLSAGPVWDAMAAPLLALPPGRPRRLLILGFAGGSVARVARGLFPRVHIVGVDKDGDVVAAAREAFGVDRLGVELVVDDALAYLERERRRFDAVIEDLYVGSARWPRKPEGLFERYELVRRRVAPGGILVMDTIHETAQALRLLAQGPGTLLEVDVKDYYNRILCAGPPSLRAGRLRRALRAHPLLAPSLPRFALRTRRR